VEAGLASSTRYGEAERLIELARQADIQRPPAPAPGRIDVGAGLPGRTERRELYAQDPANEKVRNLLAGAQVHATLALAAALDRSPAGPALRQLRPGLRQPPPASGPGRSQPRLSSEATTPRTLR